MREQNEVPWWGVEIKQGLLERMTGWGEQLRDDWSTKTSEEPKPEILFCSKFSKP